MTLQTTAKRRLKVSGAVKHDPQTKLLGTQIKSGILSSARVESDSPVTGIC